MFPWHGDFIDFKLKPRVMMGSVKIVDYEHTVGIATGQKCKKSNDCIAQIRAHIGDMGIVTCENDLERTGI